MTDGVSPDQAAQEIAKIDAELDALPAHAPGRMQLVEKKVALWGRAHPPTPPPTPTGITFADRLAAKKQIDANLEAMSALPEGHPDARWYIEQNIALAHRARAPLATAPTTNLPYDIVQADLPTPGPEPEPELAKIPPLGGTEQWNVPALEQMQGVADGEGLGDAMPTILHVVARAHGEGRKWTAASALAELTSLHGAERAAQLVAEADAFDQQFLSRAPKFREFLSRLGLLHDPEVVSEAISSWKRAKGVAS